MESSYIPRLSRTTRRLISIKLFELDYPNSISEQHRIHFFFYFLFGIEYVVTITKFSPTYLIKILIIIIIDTIINTPSLDVCELTLIHCVYTKWQNNICLQIIIIA